MLAFGSSHAASAVGFSKPYGMFTGAVEMRLETPAFPLTSRGFHWINEVPYNR